jgi:hypothetical protein
MEGHWSILELDAPRPRPSGFLERALMRRMCAASVMISKRRCGRGSGAIAIRRLRVSVSRLWVGWTCQRPIINRHREIWQPEPSVLERVWRKRSQTSVLWNTSTWMLRREIICFWHAESLCAMANGRFPEDHPAVLGPKLPFDTEKSRW